MLKRKSKAIISILLCFSLIFGSSASVYSSSFFDDGTEIQATEETAKVRAPFIIVPIFDEASIFSGIVGFLWVYSRVTVKGYSGSFTEIALNDSKETGYMLSFCLSDSSAHLLVRYANIFMDQTRNILKDYDNPQDFSWSVSKDGIISIDKNTGVVTPINPGTVVVTAKYNGKSSKCVVSAINRWENQETAKAQNNVILKSSPANSSHTVYDVITVSKDTELIAVGDTAQTNGQIYVKVKNGDGYKYGHIKLSDFSGIDYMMFQYHYFDNGYESRFNDDGRKIIQYTYVLDDIMMANFGLKVVPYTQLYNSVADECKNKSYTSVDKDNISANCPKTIGHYSDSCLTTEHLRDDLKSQFGDGRKSISKVAWTGHIMLDHENDRSNSIVGLGTIIITPYGRVNSNSYSNLSDSKIKEESIYTLVHETGHYFGLYDHYCANDKDSNGGICTNTHCSDCNGEPIPYGCLMLERQTINNSTLTKLYCDDCKGDIQSCIEDF